MQRGGKCQGHRHTRGELSGKYQLNANGSGGFIPVKTNIFSHANRIKSRECGDGASDGRETRTLSTAGSSCCYFALRSCLRYVATSARWLLQVSLFTQYPSSLPLLPPPFPVHVAPRETHSAAVRKMYYIQPIFLISVRESAKRNHTAGAGASLRGRSRKEREKTFRNINRAPRLPDALRRLRDRLGRVLTYDEKVG